MKRHGNLFDEAIRFESLLAAARRARAGTRPTEAVCKFNFRLENELLRLQGELLDGSYRPRPYRFFTVQDPKRRRIAVADFRDRVVHHAVVGALEPIFEKTFIHDSYATRKGKGSHAAVFRAQQFLRQGGWFFKTDIEKCFDSVRHDLLLAQVARKIKDPRLLELVARILENGASSPLQLAEGQGAELGLPIGNLTSQFFANVHLHDLDVFVKNELRVRHYLRYMDDFVLFFSEKSAARAARAPIADWLSENLSLRLKAKNTLVNSAANGLPFLGTRIFPALIRFHPENARRAERKLLQKKQLFERGECSPEAWAQSLQAYHAIFSAYGTHALRKHIFEKHGLLA